MFKKNDNIIISVICFFLGIFLVSQYYSGIEASKLTQPEKNEVLAIEVSKLTRTNAELRREVSDLTANLDSYRNSSESTKKIYDQYLVDVARFDVLNGNRIVTGQGVIVNITGDMVTPQIVDLVNAIKNIGAQMIEINGKRLVLNTEMSQFANQGHYEIKILGNSTLLKSAIERKGGIVDQISTKDIIFSVTANAHVEIGTGIPINLKYGRIVEAK